MLIKHSIKEEKYPLVVYDALENDIPDESILPTPIKTRKKRDDLQCWRTVAIVGVLVFHIWPNWFPNGFVGVDIFFVLSGFLMSMIIHRHDSRINFSITKDFYFRRIKRIVPVYLFVILVVLFLLFFALWEDEFDKVKRDAYWALSFLSNEQDLFEQRDYFDTQNNFRYFKHCWSLAVEMQFYLIVPMLFMLWLNFWTSGKLIILAIMFITSLTFQIMSTSETTRYESMLSRIWQFSVGIAAQSYKLTFIDFSSILHNVLIQTIFFFCLVLEFFPVALNREAVSILCVISSGFLIAVSSSGEDSPFNMYLINNTVKKFLVYCGDFSYILYLIHWPIITYFMFTKANSDFSTFEGGMIILACFMVTIIAHHLVENPLIEYSNSFINLFVITGLLYSLIAIPLTYQFPHLPNIKTFNQLTDQKYALNIPAAFVPVNGSDPLPSFYGYPVSPLTFEMFRRILRFDERIILPEGWSKENEIEFAQKVIQDACETWNYNCQDTYEKWTTVPKIRRMTFCESSLFPNGNYTALIIGNSHAQCGSGAVHMNPMFRKVITMSAHGVHTPFQSDLDEEAVLATKAMIDVTKKFQPDIVFYINFHKGALTSEVKNPITEDHGFQILDRMIKEISKHTQAIIINRFTFKFKVDVSSEFIRLRAQDNRINFKVPRLSENSLEKNQDVRKRFDALHCSKCYFWDYSEVFCGENYCNPIDEDTELPFMRDRHHAGILMQRKFRPFLDKLIKKALNISNVNEHRKK